MTLQDKLKEIFQDAIRARWEELEPFLLDQVVASATHTYRFSNSVSNDTIKEMLEKEIVNLNKTKFSKALTAIAEHDARKVLREKLKRRNITESLLFPDEAES